MPFFVDERVPIDVPQLSRLGSATRCMPKQLRVVAREADLCREAVRLEQVGLLGKAREQTLAEVLRLPHETHAMTLERQPTALSGRVVLGVE